MSKSIKWYLNRVREYQKGDAGDGIRGFAVFPANNALMLWATDKCQGACVIDPSFPVDTPSWYANARGDKNTRAYPMAQTAISQFLARCDRQGTPIRLPLARLRFMASIQSALLTLRYKAYLSHYRQRYLENAVKLFDSLGAADSDPISVTLTPATNCSGQTLFLGYDRGDGFTARVVIAPHDRPGDSAPLPVFDLEQHGE